MKRITTLNIIRLGGRWSSATVVPRAEMAKLAQAEEIIQDARRRAARYLQQARARNHAQRARLRRRLAQAQRMHQKHCARQLQQAKEQGTNAALGWLIEQQHWEHQVYQRLTHQIAHGLAARLSAISQRIPWEQMLSEQLASLCQEFHDTHPLTLKVAPALFERLPEEILRLPLTVVRDGALLAGDACLESPMVRIELKLPGQIAQLCQALSSLEWTQLYEPN